MAEEGGGAQGEALGQRRRQWDEYDAMEDDLGALTPEELELLEERRSAELALVSKFDKTEINPRRECWFLIDTTWIRDWSLYMEGKRDSPGRISNLNLFEADERTVKRKLVPKQDYRGLSPLMWYIFVELYGKDAAPELCRYSLDIYAPGVAGKYREQASKGAALQARVEVSNMREEFIPESDEESVDDEPVCCCVYQRQLQCFLFHTFTCCAHLGKRGPIYAKLRSTEEDEDDEDDLEDFEHEDEEDEEEELQRRRKRKAKRKEALTQRQQPGRRGSSASSAPPRRGRGGTSSSSGVVEMV
uniref:DUSP domain-containing protein n=1 Tax=Rhizochromulina marina TaxID=1034831 RepID=A0A6U1BH02_9STRA